MIKCILKYFIFVNDYVTHLKRPWCWERLRAGGEGDDRGWDGWSGPGFGWTLGVGDGQGGLACCGSWDLKELDTTEQLNWTDVTKVNFLYICYQYVEMQQISVYLCPATSTLIN